MATDPNEEKSKELTKRQSTEIVRVSQANLATGMLGVVAVVGILQGPITDVVAPEPADFPTISTPSKFDEEAEILFIPEYIGYFEEECRRLINASLDQRETKDVGAEKNAVIIGNDYLGMIQGMTFAINGFPLAYCFKVGERFEVFFGDSGS